MRGTRGSLPSMKNDQWKMIYGKFFPMPMPMPMLLPPATCSCLPPLTLRAIMHRDLFEVRAQQSEAFESQPWKAY
jgi:hypothetical protein